MLVLQDKVKSYRMYKELKIGGGHTHDHRSNKTALLRKQRAYHSGISVIFFGVQKIPVLTQIYRFFSANLYNNIMIYLRTGFKIDNSKFLILLIVHLRDCYRS